MASRGRKPGNPKVADLEAGRRGLALIEGGGGDGGGAPPPKAPPAPDWITAAPARALWDRLLPDLLRRKKYLGLFETQLGIYCVAFAEYVEADEAVKTDGLLTRTPNDYAVQSPYLAIRNRAGDIMMRIAGDLCLNATGYHRLAEAQFDLFEDYVPPAPGGGPGPETRPESEFGKLRRLR